MDERIAVIGAGVMGAGIAQVMALAGHRVVGYDTSADAVATAPAIVESGRFGLRGAVERGKLSADDLHAVLGRLTFTDDLDVAVDGADVVIEAVPERLDLKIAVFRDLDARCAPSAILASNSSGFPIQALASATGRPDRVIGWHWASPAPVMRMAEIVRGPATSDHTVETIVRLAAAAGKNPVVVKDTAMAWGYVANRIYGAMLKEAHRVIDEGIADRAQIDQLMVDCFRWPSGPFGMVRGAGTGWSSPDAG